MTRDRDEHLEQLAKARRQRRDGRAPAGAPPGAMTVSAFAKRIGCSRQALYTWLDRGYVQPDGYAPSGRQYFLPSSVERFQETHLYRGQQARVAEAMRRCAKRLERGLLK